jgi:hypothetical protein
MSDFLDLIDEAVGTAADRHDIRLPIVPCFEYGFISGPIRIFRGQGKLFSQDGRTWLGSIDSRGIDHHQTPALRDGRDGSSERLEFGLPFLDKTTYDAIRTLEESVAGRMITVYLAAVLASEGLRPTTALEFLGRYTMQSPTFSDGYALADGIWQRQYKITVVAKNANAGRSRAPRGTYSDTSQQERAAQLGVAADHGCGFVAALANKTISFP